MDTKTPRLVLKLLILGLGALAVHCDDPVPPSAQGAVKYRFKNQPNSSCASPSTTENIGTVTNIENAPVTNGDGGNQVACSVRAQAGGFSFSGSLTQGDNSFNISGLITPGQPSPVTVQFHADSLKATFISNPDKLCTLSVDPGEGEKFAVASGKIWAKFSCPDMIQSGASSDVPHCAIAGGTDKEPGGYVIFQNCEELGGLGGVMRGADATPRASGLDFTV